MNGRFGPYINFEKKNYKIAKGTDPATLSLEQCKEIIEKTPTKKKGGAKAKATAKKPAAKKKAAKKASTKKASAKKAK